VIKKENLCKSTSKEILKNRTMRFDFKPAWSYRGKSVGESEKEQGEQGRPKNQSSQHRDHQSFKGTGMFFGHLVRRKSLLILVHGWLPRGNTGFGSGNWQSNGLGGCTTASI
jgi:hypothetical protein